MNSRAEIRLSDVVAAQSRIATFARRTPLKRSMELSRRFGTDIRLKLESMQDTGSFKIRGAANRILKLQAEKEIKGLAAVSSGNHGRSVAYIANRLSIPATIFMTHLVPKNKIEAIRALGAKLVIHGNDQDEAELEAVRIAERDGLDFIPPFDHADVIAGQGTIALEILEDWPEVRSLIIPLSGGGLLAGVALAAKKINPEIKIIGISCTRAAAMHESIEAGHLVSVIEESSLADALPGPIAMSNQYTFRLCKDLIDEMVQIEEEDIARGMQFAFRHERLILEGAGAIGIAHLLATEGRFGTDSAIVCSGDNVDMDKFLTLI
jgi:threonine dehydratase